MSETQVEIKAEPAAPAPQPQAVTPGPSQSDHRPSDPGQPDAWQSFRREMAQLFDRFDGNIRLPSIRALFDPAPAGIFGASMPAVDVHEEVAAYVVTAELPGLDAADVTLTLAGDQLVLAGEKRQESERKDADRHVSERVYGTFRRSFLLPRDVAPDGIAATFAKGVLTITLPKTAEAAARRTIEVKAA
ncbi:Hsp20/alpha crystallin family protein (plasmid) [Tistrella mobilis]|jgi:HSP20 family protein|uniref:Hsp20/alpha crystallin family protein n=1 Tax=Tistrella mobilis TaxID=171437 RepID=UPI003557AD64